MLISVIIPTYGHPEYLVNAIESVLNQTISNWELIIVDDNNPDSKSRKETEKICLKKAEQDKRITYIKHPYNKNGASARNTGIEAAKGEIISFLDSDDEYMPDRLEKCIRMLDNANKNVAGVYTGCEFKRGGKTYYRYKGVKSGRYLVQTLAGNFMFCTGSNIFVRKSVIEELNGFDVSFLRHQDYEFLVRLFNKYSLAAIPELLVIKNNEEFNAPDVIKMISIKRQYLEKYKHIISNLSMAEQNFIYHTHCISIAEQALSQKNNEISKKYYRKSKIYGSLTLRELFRKICLKLMLFINH